MKFNKWTLGLIGGLLAGLCVGFFTGCSTPPAQTAATEQLLVTMGAEAATVAVLQKNPEYAPDFVAGGALLTGIAAGNPQLTPADVNLALTAAGQTNSAAAFIAPMAATLLNTYAQSNTNVLNATTAQVAGWLGAGFTAGAASVPK